jgi:hypothetical protein
MLATIGSFETISFVKWPYLIPRLWDRSGSSMFLSFVRNYCLNKLAASEDMAENMDCRANQKTDTRVITVRMHTL